MAIFSKADPAEKRQRDLVLLSQKVAALNGRESNN